MTEPVLDPRREAVPEWVKQEKQAHDAESAQPDDAATEGKPEGDQSE